MTPKISVVIPCYNMGQFVTEAIDSVLSYPIQEAVEIIVVNDGSDDDGYTENILNTLNKPNVSVFHQENKGLGNARNTGVKLAKAKYVLLLDSDNKIRHSYIKNGIEILDSKPQVGLVYGNLKRFGLDEMEVDVGGFDASKLVCKNYIDACAVLRKDAWLSVGGYDEFMPVMGYEDWDINMRLFFKGWQFEHLNIVCFDYRVRENSMLVNSNLNKELLLDYMFSKPELVQAKLIRDKILLGQSLKTDHTKFKKKKLIKVAMWLDENIKPILKFRK